MKIVEIGLAQWLLFSTPITITPVIFDTESHRVLFSYNKVF